MNDNLSKLPKSGVIYVFLEEVITIQVKHSDRINKI